MRRFAGLATAAVLTTALVVEPIVDGCTAFLASGEDGVLFGNNEYVPGPQYRSYSP